jgi:type I restriction enzyme, S subunit
MKKPQNPQPPERGLLEIERPCQGSGVSLGVSSINLKPEHLKIVKEILFKFIPNTEVWAFGSRVKFTNAEFADLDLVIVDENKQSLTIMADLEEAFEQSDLPFEVDILDYCSIAEHLKKEINKKYMKLIDPKSVKEGYKDTPLGLIPKDWEIVRLGDVGKFAKGKGIRKDQVVDNGIPCIRYGEIYTQHHEYIKKFYSFIDDEIARESQRIEKGDILFAGSGETAEEIGKCVAYTFPQEAYAGGDIIIFSPSNAFNSLFLGFLLNSERINTQKSVMGQGNSVVHIYSSSLSNLQIPLPPLEEQKKIAEILSTWDQGIDKLSGLIERKKHLKKGLMQKLLTGRVRTPNPLKGGFKEIERPISSSPPSGDLGVSFPEDWEVVRLGDICNIRRGASPRPINNPDYFAETGRGWIRISDVTSSKIYLRTTTQYLSDYGVKFSVPVDPGDLILSICATIGIPIIVDIPACIHDGFVLFRGYEDRLMKFFLYFFLISQCEKLSGQGQPGTQKNLNTEIVGNIQIPLPPLEEQKKIAEILSTQDKEIDKLEKKLELFKQQKKGLMQILLTGRVRV